MKVYLVDDHSILLEGLVKVLQQQEGIDVVGYSTSGKEALEYVAAHPVDVLVTDQSMPGIQGLEIVRRLRKTHPGLKLVVLTMHDELHLYLEMKKEGVHGYVLKRDSEKELLEALVSVQKGEHFASPDLVEALNNMPDSGQARLLSKREKEILKLIVGERSNKEIASALFISELTVETHRKNIFRKTGAKSLAGLVNFAHSNGIS